MTLLWQPQEDQIAATNLARFQSFINARFDRDCRSFWDLHDFSVHDNARFWDGFWDFAKVIGDKGGDKKGDDGGNKGGDKDGEKGR